MPLQRSDLKGELYKQLIFIVSETNGVSLSDTLELMLSGAKNERASSS